MIVKTDKNKAIKIETTYEDEQFLIQAHDLLGNYLGYAEVGQYVAKEAWLFQVKTFPEYRNQGVGSVLLDMVSFWSAKMCCNMIAGKFAPSSDYAKEFYFKNGFYIYPEDNYNRLEKPIEEEKVIKEIKEKYNQEPKCTYKRSAIREIVNFAESNAKQNETFGFAKK